MFRASDSSLATSGGHPSNSAVTTPEPYLLYLVQEKKVSWSVYNQTLCALRFLYEITLGRKDVLDRIPFPKQPKRLPVVLSSDEVATFFAGVIDIKHRAILVTAYAAGLRLSEVIGLRKGKGTHRNADSLRVFG